MADEDKNAQDKGKEPEGTPSASSAPQPTTGTDPVKTEGDTPRTFTQEDLDKIVSERLERERRKLKEDATKKYADYDDLKAKAAKYQEIENANKTEQEKAAERLAAVEKRAQELEAQNARLAQERTEIVLRSAVITEATKQGFVDPSDAYAMLDIAQVEIDKDSGEPKNLEKLLTVLAKAKPYLVRQQAQLSATNPAVGHSDTETPEQRRSRLFGAGSTPIGTAQGGGVFMPKP